MGVQGLWNIIEPTGQAVSPDSLRGKVLAIDVSIWLHQAVKGYRDKDGTPLPNAHLLGVFHRVCKLLHYGVKPVFVFDGGVPALKKQTMTSRKQKKIEASDKSEVARKKLLSNFLQQRLQRETKKALPPSLRMAAKISALASAVATSSKKSPIKKNALANFTEEASDLYEFHQKLMEDEKFEEEEKSSEDDDDEEEEENFDILRNHYYADHFSTITSANFDTLPLESQHEILFQMQESKKTNSWNKMQEMPRELVEFSSFQMDRLLKRRFLQKKIQSVQKEMGQRHIYVQNLDELAMYEAEFGTEVDERQIIGSKDKGALLIKPKVNLTPSEVANGNNVNRTSPTPGTSGSQPVGRSQPSRLNDIEMEDYVNLCSSSEEDDDHLIKISNPKFNHKGKLSEEDADIQLAIQLSLDSAYCNRNNTNQEQESNHVSMSTTVDNADADADANTELEQAIQLSLKATSRDENVTVELKSHDNISSGSGNRSPRKTLTQTETNPIVNEFNIAVTDDVTSPCYKFLGWVGFSEKVSSNVISPLKSKPEAQKMSSPITISSDSESDDDNFEIVEVCEKDNGDEKRIEDERSLVEYLIANLPPIKGKTEESINESRGMKIRINENTELKEEDDLFADVFKGTNKDLGSKLNSEIVPASASESQITQPESNYTEGIAELVIDLGSDTYCEQLGNGSGNNDKTKHREEMEGITQTLGSIPIQETTPEKAKSVRMISMDYLQNQEKLQSERGKLQVEMGQQERISTSITDQMYTEAQELLTLFGIPFVVSPMEAESQCAFLDSAGLTQGTITDDSDIWLFGGLRVYKNFFSQGDKHVELFQYADIVRKLHFDREKLVVMAILTGSDYTHGIEGVGPVTAVEILTEFSTNSISAFDSLIQFSDWWKNIQTKKDFVNAENKTREKFRKLQIRPGFPSRVVYDAYIKPTIDTSTEPFRWGKPELDLLRHYTKLKFGWDQNRTDTILQPAFKEFECQDKEIKRQSTLDNFVTILDKAEKFSNRKTVTSKRLLRAMKKLKRNVGRIDPPNELDLSNSSNSDSESKCHSSEDEVIINGRRKRKQKTVSSSVRPKAKRNKESQGNLRGESQIIKCLSDTPNTRKGHIPKKATPISEIPQKFKDDEERKKNKEKAIEILKKKKLK